MPMLEVLAVNHSFLLAGQTGLRGRERTSTASGEARSGWLCPQRLLCLSLAFFCGKLWTVNPMRSLSVPEVCQTTSGRNYSENNSFIFGKASSNIIHLFLEKQAQIPKSRITSGAMAFRFIFSVILASDKSLMCVFNLCFFFPLPMLSYFTQNNCHSVTLDCLNNFKSVLNSGS